MTRKTQAASAISDADPVAPAVAGEQEQDGGDGADRAGDILVAVKPAPVAHQRRIDLAGAMARRGDQGNGEEVHQQHGRQQPAPDQEGALRARWSPRSAAAKPPPPLPARRGAARCRSPAPRARWPGTRPAAATMLNGMARSAPKPKRCERRQADQDGHAEIGDLAQHIAVRWLPARRRTASPRAAAKRHPARQRSAAAAR